MDLQILNTPQKSQKESSPSQIETAPQGEPFSQPLEEHGDVKTTTDSINAPNLKIDTGTRNTPDTEPEKFLSSLVDVNSLASQTNSSENLTHEASAQPTASSTTVEPEFNQHMETQLNEDKTEDTTNQSSVAAKDLIAEDLMSTVVGLVNQTPSPLQQEQQPEESQNPPLPAQEPRHQANPSDKLPEPSFNQLLQSQWQKTQRKELSNPLTATTGNDVENSLELFERWQRLLLTQEMMDSRKAIEDFKKKLESLEYQIYEPTQLINLLLPLITEVLSLKIAAAREDVAHAIAPIVDEMIQRRAQQDKGAVSSVLAPVLPQAITYQVVTSPGDLAKALGPEMGPAIKEQISLERDVMVDALYPVIGSTISKYMAEAIQSINEKVENAFSVEGMSRKIRAKLQGISEAELIFKEAMPFTVQAIFLIHKASGLVIAEVQPSNRQRLESEMVAGMLTAIRSFVNDCIAQSGEVSEIDEIDYGGSKIILEVAGYCYVAAVTQGEPPKSFMRKMRGALETIVQHHGKPIELFDGDPSNVPDEIHQILQELTKLSQSPQEEEKRKTPVALLLVGLAALSAIVIPTGIYHHLSAVDRQREERTRLALASDPELAVYRLEVDASLGNLKLSGKLPNEYLRTKAEQIAKKVEPNLNIQNAIIPVEVPPDPVLAAAEVKRVTSILNQIEGTIIKADYTDGNVTVEGVVLQEADAKKITQAFQQIPGVQSVTNTVQLQPLAIASRVYFDQGSAQLKAEERSKILQIQAFLEQHPNKHLKLLGHTDPKGTATENQELALERAKTVRDALIKQGIDPKRLQVEGTIDSPLGVKAEQIPLLSRCVEFKIISP